MPHPNADVRMRGFVSRSTVEEALAWLDAQVATLPAEECPLAAAAGRVLCGNIESDVDVPGFDRAMMDGYALLAADTIGATPTNRLPLSVLGQALPGAAFAGTVAHGQAVRVMTGAPMPNGADAVLPAELTSLADPSNPQSSIPNSQSVQVLAELPAGKNFGRRGEDIVRGTVVLPAGRRLRPQDIGVLSSIGRATVPVVRRPRVRIVVTGDELLPLGTVPTGHRIADANGPMLAALVRRDGGEVLSQEMVADRRDAILAAIQQPCDVLLVSGGSSVGLEDHVPTLLAEHGELAVHGIAMRPSSPTGLGRIGAALVLLMPGNPVSCLCAYDFFAGRAIRTLGGLARDWPYRSVRLKLAGQLKSAKGRVDYARVMVVDGHVEPIGISGASVLSSTTRADGFVIVPAKREVLPLGEEVEVYLYD
ncbi:MAG: molybdopterin molybdotransferase MoeA [Planctomycetia bacterium]|nr:molybdopterin molybdotransferase MoeA [Planctomycetia bacterium]